MSLFPRPLIRYMGVSALYGFVRGYQCEYYYNRYTDTISVCSSPKELWVQRLVEKTFRGVVNACIYGSLGNPVAMYHLLCRIEIYSMKKRPREYVSVYTEFTGYTDIKP